ncbi:UNKNOWN [Stylonychia lemnae]|uniref:Uncharacterized protein n=1 Tax=Stylonychia lemnae TaxID=5949 RepID=A0A078AN98_STYLE|nr:UNKNOWN [Stylonychia lemnae]|eukprot:CDW82408.1 UNKNOWN [Stylonychia lemnae]
MNSREQSSAASKSHTELPFLNNSIVNKVKDLSASMHRQQESSKMLNISDYHNLKNGINNSVTYERRSKQNKRRVNSIQIWNLNMQTEPDQKLRHSHLNLTNQYKQYYKKYSDFCGQSNPQNDKTQDEYQKLYDQAVRSTQLNSMAAISINNQVGSSNHSHNQSVSYSNHNKSQMTVNNNQELPRINESIKDVSQFETKKRKYIKLSKYKQNRMQSHGYDEQNISDDENPHQFDHLNSTMVNVMIKRF